MQLTFPTFHSHFCLIHICDTMKLIWSYVAIPKYDETIMLRHPSASSLDGPQPPFVLIAVFLLALRQCYRTKLDVLFVSFLEVTSVVRCIFYQDVLTPITEEFYLLVLLVNILRSPLTFPFSI